MAGGRTGGGRADRRTWGKGEAERRTARRLEADGQTSGRADESGQGGLAVWRTGGRVGDLKGPAPRSPLHSRAPKLLASLRSEFAGAWECTGVPAGVMLFSFCSEQHICNSGTAVL